MHSETIDPQCCWQTDALSLAATELLIFSAFDSLIIAWCHWALQTLSAGDYLIITWCHRTVDLQCFWLSDALSSEAIKPWPISVVHSLMLFGPQNKFEVLLSNIWGPRTVPLQCCGKTNALFREASKGMVLSAVDSLMHHCLRSSTVMRNERIECHPKS